jgi:hypothetical protein
MKPSLSAPSTSAARSLEGSRAVDAAARDGCVDTGIGKRGLLAAAGLALLLGQPGLVAAQGNGCRNDMLRGQYVFTATGHTRASAADPWVPKAIIEFIYIQGDGTLSTPAVSAANAFGNSGSVSVTGPGNPGVYSVNDDCTGTVQFTPGPTFNIFVQPLGREFWMIQANPNNVFQGNVKRLW